MNGSSGSNKNTNTAAAAASAVLANALAAAAASAVASASSVNNISPKYSSSNDFAINGGSNAKTSLESSISNVNNNSNSMENTNNNIDDMDYYDSGDDGDSIVYQSVGGGENAAYIGSNLMQHQQNAQVRHVPSGTVDQLELTEEVEMLVSRDVIKKCLRKAKHRGNFAANLAAELFNKEERITCNCTGTRGNFD